MKIQQYVVACGLGAIVAVIVIYFTHANAVAQKKTLNTADAMSRPIVTGHNNALPQTNESQPVREHDTVTYSPGSFPSKETSARQEDAQQAAPAQSYGEREKIALYDTDEAVRAFAIRNLEDTPAARQILAMSLTDPAPHIRNAALERIIELEDQNNRVFSADVNALLENETDNAVIETALSYYSLTESEATYSVVMNVIERPSLSADVLAYAGEILYKHYKMDQDKIDQLIETSPSYASLDQPQVIRLEEDLGEVFTAEN